MNPGDRAKAALAAFVDFFASRYDYAAAASCTVVAENADGTLELEPESSRLPPLSSVPIRWGAPGVSAVRVRPGARVLVEFEGGSAASPVVTAWDSATTVRDVLTFDTSGAAGKAPIARKGDAVSVAFPLGMTIAAGVTLPPAPPQVITVCTILPPPQVSGGIITSGNPRVLA